METGVTNGAPSAGQGHYWLASDSWCAWTTFSSLSHMLTYWQAGLPDGELQEQGTQDGVCGASASHMPICPSDYSGQFSAGERSGKEQGYSCGEKQQDIQASPGVELEQLASSIPPDLLVLEIKLVMPKTAMG